MAQVLILLSYTFAIIEYIILQYFDYLKVDEYPGRSIAEIESLVVFVIVEFLFRLYK